MPIATRDSDAAGRPSAREAILDAARSLFAEHGLRGTTVRAIAQRSGFSNTLLYYYFPRKDDLVEALLQPPAPPPPPELEGWGPAEFVIALRYLEDAFFQWADGDDFLRMVIMEAYAGNTRVIAMSVRELELYTAAITPLLAVGYGDERVAREHAESLGYTTSGLLWQAVMHDGREYRRKLASPEGRARLRAIFACALARPRLAVGAS